MKEKTAHKSSAANVSQLVEKWQEQLAYQKSIRDKNKGQNTPIQRVEYGDAKTAMIFIEEFIKDLGKLSG